MSFQVPTRRICLNRTSFQTHNVAHYDPVNGEQILDISVPLPQLLHPSQPNSPFDSHNTMRPLDRDGYPDMDQTQCCLRWIGHLGPLSCILNAQEEEPRQDVYILHYLHIFNIFIAQVSSFEGKSTTLNSISLRILCVDLCDKSLDSIYGHCKIRSYTILYFDLLI